MKMWLIQYKKYFFGKEKFKAKNTLIKKPGTLLSRRVLFE
jgi:hypothetical protein